LDAPGFAPALQLFSALLDEIEQTVSTSAWLAGGAFSLAEVAVAPYVTRLQMLAMSPLWDRGRRPALARWWDGVQARASWQREVRDVFAPAARQAMDARGRAAWPAVAKILGLPAGPP